MGRGDYNTKYTLILKVYVCERLYPRREFYFAILFDRASQGPVLVGSSQGGMDIEGVAAENPNAIITDKIDITQGVSKEQALKFAKSIGFGDQYLESV